MTDENSTEQTWTVIAELRDFMPERGYGFASSYELRDADSVPRKIFFHVSKQRKVAGTPKKPHLTKMRGSHKIDLDDPQQARQRLLMEVKEGDKGLRTVAWGVLPQRTGLTDLTEDGGVERFIGGVVSIYHFRRRDSLLLGTLKNAKIVNGYLELEIVAADINGHTQEYPVVETFVLGEETTGTPMDDGSYTLLAPEPGETYRMDITFRPAGE